MEFFFYVSKSEDYYESMSESTEYSDDEKKQLRLAQLFQVVSKNLDSKIVERFLEEEDEVNINWIIPAQYLPNSEKLNFDCTMLHLAYIKQNIDTFRYLLEFGADFTIKNQDGSSVLHFIYQNLKKQAPDDWIHLDDSFVELTLYAQVANENTQNPCDKNGLSHFHIACMANDTDAIKFFLDNGVLIDQSVSMNSPVRCGYTPLHCAAEFCSYEIAEFLISNGADIHLKNGDGMTVLHLLITERLKMFEIKRSLLKEEAVTAISKKIEFNEQIINLILMNDTTNVDVGDSVGLSNFHVACTLQDSSLVECLLDQIADINHSVEADSPVSPGYTGLHFAAHCSVNTVKMLVEKGANLTVENKEGVTPWNICMKWFNPQDIHSLIELVPGWKNIIFSGMKTKLLDCILAMENTFTLKAIFKKCCTANMSLPTTSQLWPGFTPLHLAVELSERFGPGEDAESLVQVCLDQGIDIHAQDIHGWTPLHLAFRQNKQQIVNCLLEAHGMISKKVVNLSDEDGLSYLHMSFTDEVTSQCAFGRKLLLAKQTDTSAINAIYKGEPLLKVKPGWTPLHVAASMGDYYAMCSLLTRGANLFQTDYQGFTALHRLFAVDQIKQRNCKIDEMKSSLERLEECVVESIGLTHLHVVSWLNKPKVVQLLLEKGSDIEATIQQPLEEENHLAKFVGCTPLHVAIMSDSADVVKELLQWGADIFAKKPDITSPLSLALTGKNNNISNMFFLLLWSDEKLQNLMKKKLGLTMLHVACYMIDVKKVRALAKNGVGMNESVHKDSNIWPGCTAMHVLLMKIDECRYWEIEWKKVETIFGLLVKNGADFTLTDTQHCTPLQLIFKSMYYSERVKLINLIFKHHRDYKINPTDNRGLSYFHLACVSNNFEAVQKFLQQICVDVNQPTDVFLREYGGFSPLHFALYKCAFEDVEEKPQQRTVEILLNGGAEISVECSRGCTPLHLLIQWQRGKHRFSLIKEFLQYCSRDDINARNVQGETPLEIMLSRWSSCDAEDIKILINNGALINNCNPVTNKGYIAMLYNHFSKDRYDKQTRDDLLQKILYFTEMSNDNEMARNPIHNAVAASETEGPYHSFMSFLNTLSKMGCDIDCQDKFGKTPLHLAVGFRNLMAVISLLMSGADLNIVDSSGKSPFCFIFEPEISDGEKDELTRRKQRIVNIFVEHVETCKLLQIYVSALNLDTQSEILQKSKDGIVSIFRDSVFDELRETESIKIGQRELNLRSFLYGTGVISMYPSITPVVRNEIADFFTRFFENENTLRRFRNLIGLIQLQYRKAVNRLSLISPAGDALKILLGFPLPDLCIEIILIYLSNSELKNLTAAPLCCKK